LLMIVEWKFNGTLLISVICGIWGVWLVKILNGVDPSVILNP